MGRLILGGLIIFCLVTIARADSEVTGTIEKIEIQGAAKIREKFIRREITIEIGEKFDLKKAIEDKNAIIRNLKYIEQVNLYIKPGSEEGKLIVIFEIQETKSKSLTLNAGYSDEEKFFGFCQVWYENFLHRGMHLGVGLKKGKNVDCSSFTLYEPRLFHTPYSFKLKIYSDGYKRTQLPYEDRGKYWIDQDGFLLEFGKRAIFKNVNLRLKYRDENVQVSEDYPEITTTKPTAQIKSLIVHLNFDSCKFQDIQAKYALPFESPDETQWLNPITGGKYELLGEIVNDSLGADYNFTKYTLNLNQYLSLGNAQVLALSSKSGYINGNAPFYERFYVGGIDTIRGYKERGLTNTGGNKLLVFTTEYRFGLTNFIQGVLFTDAGYSWEKGKRINLDDLEYGIGTGIRIHHSLIGGISINLGYGLKKKDWEIHIGNL
ncbi:MAG: BamA/TamA family outer membrane protein [bacterium]